MFFSRTTSLRLLRTENSLMIQWLGLGTFTLSLPGPGFDPWLGGMGTKIPQAMAKEKTSEGRKQTRCFLQTSLSGWALLR